MKTLHYQRIEGDAAQRIRAILADRPVRVALHGEDGRVGEDEAVARWCADSGPAVAPRRLAVWCSELGDIVGGLKLDGGELSYFVARPFWGRGYGGALVRQFLRGDGARLQALSACAVRENRASRRILESAGFRQAGLARRDRGLPWLVAYERRPDLPADARTRPTTAFQPPTGA